METILENKRSIKFSITVPKKTKLMLDDYVPSRKRSKFINNALEKALEDEATKRASDVLDRIKPVSTDKDSVSFLRESRKLMDERSAN